MSKISDFTAKDIKFRNSTVGLLDMCVGFAFLLAGISFLFNAVAVTAPFYLVILITITIINQKIVYPRIGYVEHKGMNQRVRKTMTLTLILGVVMLFAATIAYLNIASGSKSEMMRSIALNYGGLILGVVIALVAALVGKTFESPRFYIYAPVIFATFCAMQFINYDYIIAVSCFVLGIVIFTIGLVFFIKFIKNYPRLDGDGDE